jgi:8-oxo-dGTP diphosphatase
MRRVADYVLSKIIPLAILGRAIYRRIRRPVTVGVRAMVIEDDKVLLVRMHGSTIWDLPGGGVKRGEALHEAAVRETYEETGSSVTPEFLLGMYFHQYKGLSDHIAVFVCHPETQPVLPLNVEIAAARYWPLHALPPSTPAALHRRLAEHQAGKQGLAGRW